jgi:hypothetical protein
MYAKSPPIYGKLSTASRARVDRLNPRQVRPSELKALASALHRDGAISASQKMELDMIRKPYAGLDSDEPFDLVKSMESAAAFTAGFERYVPGSGCAAYYKTMVHLAQWLESTATLHRRAPAFSKWA